MSANDTVVKACKKNCKVTHAYQDKKYGNGVRVMNKRTSKKETPEYRCTVCGEVV